jgi:restriction endonuclease S subunit
MVKLDEICNFIGGFAFKSEKLSLEKGKDSLPVVKIGNLSFDGKIDIDNIQFHKYSPELDKFLIKKDDILVAMTGATVGKTASSVQDNLLLNQRVGLIRSKGIVDQTYIKNMLISDHFYQFCQKNAGGGAQGNISPSQIMSYEIPVVDLVHQNKFINDTLIQDSIIESNKKLIDLMGEKIKEVLSEI